MYKVHIPYIGPDHRLSAMHSARCLKCKRIHNLVFLFNKHKFIVDDNLMLQNHLKGYPNQI